jgi:serine protease Do
MKRPFAFGRQALFVLIALLVAAMPAVVAADDLQAINHAKALSRAFRHAAEASIPSVVTVTTTVHVGGVGDGDAKIDGNPFEGTPFEEFFREFQERGGPRGVPFESNGVGSGVIVDKSGIILTNNHVLEGADEVKIRLSDGREFEAKDIRRDLRTDLAVLTIEGAGSLPAAKLGDSDDLEIGDWVIAVGNPFELEHTVSAGIISGKGRQLSAARRAMFLQTDAAINPGNSGGPLVNLDGEVIGINTAIASRSGGNQGIGFAIPSNLAKWVMAQLIEHGNVRRAYLGVGIEPITPQNAAEVGVRPGQGVLVSAVFPDTPAAEAGLQKGDVVTHFAGTAVDSPAKLQRIVERSPMNSRQQLTILRDGRESRLEVEVKALPTNFENEQRKRPLEK